MNEISDRWATISGLIYPTGPTYLRANLLTYLPTYRPTYVTTPQPDLAQILPTTNPPAYIPSPTYPYLSGYLPI